jgi:hypothetical protein
MKSLENKWIAKKTAADAKSALAAAPKTSNPTEGSIGSEHKLFYLRRLCFISNGTPRGPN